MVINLSSIHLHELEDVVVSFAPMSSTAEHAAPPSSVVATCTNGLFPRSQRWIRLLSIHFRGFQQTLQLVRHQSA